MKTFLVIFIAILYLATCKVMPASNPNFQYFGRILHSNNIKTFDWPGIYFKIKFSGPCLKVIIGDRGGRNGFNVIVDGKQTVLFTKSGQTVYPISCSLGSGLHSLVIVKRTETLLGVAEFHGIEIDDNANVSQPDPRPNRRIDFYGDSFTAGFGNEGKNHTCPFSKETQNSWLTYGAMISRNLNAEYSIQAISGSGMVRNFGDQNPTSPRPFPVHFNRTIGGNANLIWDFNWKPHATVVFLGINDYSTKPWPSEEVFANGYVRFLDGIFKHYPETRVFAVCFHSTTDPKCGYIQNIVNKYPRKQVTFVLLKDILKFPQHFGCAWHPNVEGHVEMGKVIEQSIRATMKW